MTTVDLLSEKMIKYGFKCTKVNEKELDIDVCYKLVMTVKEFGGKVIIDDKPQIANLFSGMILVRFPYQLIVSSILLIILGMLIGVTSYSEPYWNVAALWIFIISVIYIIAAIYYIVQYISMKYLIIGLIEQIKK